ELPIRPLQAVITEEPRGNRRLPLDSLDAHCALLDRDPHVRDIDAGQLDAYQHQVGSLAQIDVRLPDSNGQAVEEAVCLEHQVAREHAQTGLGGAPSILHSGARHGSTASMLIPSSRTAR